MLGILDFFFGKKTTIKVPEIGTFTARIKRNTQKEIVWSCYEYSSNVNKEITFLLLGNAKGPYQRQIEETKSILKNKEEIKEQIADLLSEIRSNMKKIQHLNIADFRLKYIGFSQDEGIIHELSYESEDGGYFGAVFKDQVIKDILI